MLFAMFQMEIRFFPEFVFFVLLPIFIIIDIIVLKIILKLTKAPERTSFKWVLISFFTQIGVLFFVASPLLLIAMTGGFENQEGPPAALIVFIPLALFIDINVLNVLHKLGFKKAVLVFIIMVVPFFVMTFVIVMMQNRLRQEQSDENQDGGGEEGGEPTIALFYLFFETLWLYMKSL